MCVAIARTTMIKKKWTNSFFFMHIKCEKKRSKRKWGIDFRFVSFFVFFYNCGHNAYRLLLFFSHCL